MQDFEFAENQRFEPSLKFEGWVECQSCRAIMYNSYGDCWSCGTDMTGNNAEPVTL